MRSRNHIIKNRYDRIQFCSTGQPTNDITLFLFSFCSILNIVILKQKQEQLIDMTEEVVPALDQCKVTC